MCLPTLRKNSLFFFKLTFSNNDIYSNPFKFCRSVCKEGSLDPKKVKGKILVCLRGDTARVDKGVQASRVGAVGMILVNDEDSGNGVIADPHVLPATNVGFADGSAIFSYINRTK